MANSLRPLEGRGVSESPVAPEGSEPGPSEESERTGLGILNPVPREAAVLKGPTQTPPRDFLD